MTLHHLDACVCGQTEHLAQCERHCGSRACSNNVAAQEPVPARIGRNPGELEVKPTPAAAAPVKRLLRWYRIHRAAAHLHQLERYYEHCERGGNCTAAELQVEWLRVHDARIALGIAYRSAP